MEELKWLEENKWFKSSPGICDSKSMISCWYKEFDSPFQTKNLDGLSTIQISLNQYKFGEDEVVTKFELVLHGCPQNSLFTRLSVYPITEEELYCQLEQQCKNLIVAWNAINENVYQTISEN